MTRRFSLESFTLRTDQLWPLIILAGFGFFVSLVPLPPNDFWWHLKIGQLININHTIPNTNMFAWTIPRDTPFFYGAWLGELLLYLLFKTGGVALVTFTRNALIIITFWLVGCETKRKSGSWRLSALAILLVSAMTINNLPVRPQIWSWVPFILMVILLGMYSDGQISGRWLLVCPILMIFWVNAHGAFILGGVLVGIHFTGALIQTLLTPKADRSWTSTYHLLLTGILTGLAILVNPRFTGILGYVMDLLTDRPSQQLIVEWQSPSPSGIANITFFATILLLLLLVAYSTYRLSATEFLLITSFLWLAWTGQRYVVWFGIVSVPVMMKLLIHLPIRTPNLYPQRNWVNLLIGVMLFLPAILVQPWFVENFPLPERYWALVQRNSPAGPLIDVDTPVNAVEYLKTQPAGKLFNEMGYGSYLIWAYPDEEVFIDPRVELYPFELWQDYIRISNGAGYNQLLSKYGVQRILLNSELQKDLALALGKDDGWRLEYTEGRSQIWVRNDTP